MVDGYPYHVLLDCQGHQLAKLFDAYLRWRRVFDMAPGYDYRFSVESTQRVHQLGYHV
jgi:hypothetical protein